MTNLTPHPHQIDPQARTAIKGHKPLVIWFTGLSGSGKSSIANELEQELNQQFLVHTYLLDGDNVRSGLNSDLGFSVEDRAENIRRIGEVAKMMLDAGLIVITAFISPYRQERDKVRRILPETSFCEVFVDCPLEICEQRDPKGLYAAARLGQISQFTGISAPYEPPLNPEIVIHSDHISIKEAVKQIIDFLLAKEIIQSTIH